MWTGATFLIHFPAFSNGTGHQSVPGYASAQNSEALAGKSH